MSNTGVYRQKINSNIATNSNKGISASKLRSTLEEGATAIDGIFETLSLSEGIGTISGASGLATIKETESTFTPVDIANQANGKYFDVIEAGTLDIFSGDPVELAVGGKVISRGTKWDYIPPSDGGYALAQEISESLPNEYTSTPKFEQVANVIPEVVTDILSPTQNGYILTTGAFFASANWRACMERPVSYGDIIDYEGVRPITSSNAAAMVGVDENKQNPVILIAASATVQPKHSEQVTINSDTIKFISASFRLTGDDVIGLIKTTPAIVTLKKEKIEGLDEEISAIDTDLSKLKALADVATTNFAENIPVQNYGFLETDGDFIANASFRAVLDTPVLPGWKILYKGVRPTSGSQPYAAVIGRATPGGAATVIIPKPAVVGFVQYTEEFTVPDGIFLISGCSRGLVGDIFEISYTASEIKSDSIPNGEKLLALSSPEKYFMPPVAYAKRGEELRIYPPGVLSINLRDKSHDVIFNTTGSNEDFGSYTPVAGDSDIQMGLSLRLIDGSLKSIGTTTIKITHTIKSPDLAMNIVPIGDSLVEGGSNSGVAGAIFNEMSRRLTGVGTALTGAVPAALALTNIYFRGTLGNQPIKHEGRVGWGLDTYLYQETRSGVANKFYNPSAPGAVKFDMNYYLTQNNFQAAQTAGGVNATGSNMVVYILLGWNHFYLNPLSQVVDWLELLVDNIHASHSGAKIKLLGLNPPPDRIAKTTGYTINSRLVSPSSIMRGIIDYSESWQAVADARSSWVEFLPVAPFFQADGSYPFVAKSSGLRGGTVNNYHTDHVHPIGVGYSYFSDVAFYNFLYHYCRLT